MQNVYQLSTAPPAQSLQEPSPPELSTVSQMSHASSATHSLHPQNYPTQRLTNTPTQEMNM